MSKEFTRAGHKGDMSRVLVKHNLRSPDRIKNRWNNICKQLGYWAGIVKLIPVGSRDNAGKVADEKCMELYQETKYGNKTFQWLECYEIVKTIPKWKTLDEAKDKRGKGGKGGKTHGKGKAVGGNAAAATSAGCQPLGTEVLQGLG